ncbi:MAG: hypothetical protein K2X66_09035 [Cyanobacteria bacterium]|nr:hypothetical protein [Cyanobacteriota bacterium]
MSINPINPNVGFPNANSAVAGTVGGPVGTAGTAAVGTTPQPQGLLPTPSPVGASPAQPAANGPLLSVVMPLLNVITSLIQGGGGVGGASAAATGAAKPAGAGTSGPAKADANIASQANSIIDKGINSITGIGANQAKTAIKDGLGKSIGQVNVNGVSADLNFSVNDLKDTLSFAKSVGLSAQNGRIDQAQLQSAISNAESSGAPANVVNTLKSLNDNWAAGEKLGIIEGGALTSGGIDKLMSTLKTKAQEAAAAKGGIAASVGGRAVNSVFGSIEQPVRQLIKDSIGL